MAILNFMPQFAPWYTKDLLKKKDDPDAVAATDSTTGIFGDVFDFIDDGFDWAATAIPEAPQQYEEPAPAYDVPPQYYDEPAPSYEPTGGFGAGIGDVFNGTGEGMGFDMLSEPTDSWASQYPSAAGADWGSEIGNEMGFTPSFPPAYTPPAPTYGFGEGIGDQFSNYFDWNSEVAPTPTPYMPPPDWGSMDIQATNPPLLPQVDQSWMNLDFPDFGNTLTDWAEPAPRYEDAVPMEFPTAIGSSLMDQPEPDPMGWGDISSMFNAARPEPTPAPQTWDIPGMENPNTGVPGWASMSPDERGQYVYFSGLNGNQYLSEQDWAEMSPDIAQKIGYADSRVSGGFANPREFGTAAGKLALNASDAVWNQTAQLGMDTIYDPLASVVDVPDWTQAPALARLDPISWARVGLDAFGNRDDFEAPLDETVNNIQNSDGIAGFVYDQNQDYKDRPFYEQLIGQVFTPGNGLLKGTKLAGVDDIADTLQGGKLLGALGDIPGASSFVKNAVLPGAAGGGVGALTEIVAPDMEYTDPITGESFNPNLWESTGFGVSAGLIGRQWAKQGMPIGFGIKDVGDFPTVKGISKWGLPNQAKGDPGVNLEWEDPLDKALYQATSKSNTKTKPAVIALLREKGLTDAEIVDGGNRVRARIASIIEELSPRQGETILVDSVARSSTPLVPELSTVPRLGGDIVDEAIQETPQERVARLTEELRLSNPEAAASSGFFPQNLVSPSVADEGLSTIPAGIVDEVAAETPRTAVVKLPPDERLSAATIEKAMEDAGHKDYMRKFYHYSGSDGTVTVDDLLSDPSAKTMKDVTRRVLDKQFPGTDTITLYRAEGPGLTSKMTSWSDDIEVPSRVVGRENVISREVPKDDVLAYYNTARGLNQFTRSGNEKEYLVLGNEGKAIVGGLAAETPRAPLVDRVINHIDAITGDRATRGEATKKAYDTWKSDLYTEILAKNGGNTRKALAEWSAQVEGVPLETYAANMPTLKESEVDQIWDIIDAKTKSGIPGMDYGAFSLKRMEKALNSLVDGVNGNPGDLAVLRNVLTDTPYQKAADDAIETVAPKAGGIVRRPNARVVDNTVEPGMSGPLDQTLDEISTAKLAPEDEAIIGADDALFPEFKPSNIERTNINDRGSFQTSLGSVDETAQYRSPGAPVIGEDDPLQRRLPLWGEADKATRPDEYPFSNPRPDVQARTPNEAVKAVDAWQADVVERGKGMQPDALNRFLDAELAKFIDENGSEVAPMAKLARAQVPSRIQKQALGEWQAPFSQAMPSGVPTDIPTESGALVSKRAAEMADVAPSNIDSVPAVIRPMVEEWEQKALNAVKGLPMTKRADELDKMQLELSRSLRGQVPDGTAVSQAERSRDRVVYALNQQNKAEMDAGLADWRETNTKDFDAIDVNAKSSWGERHLGGALKNKLADTLTSRGRDLDMYFQRQGYTFEESKDMVERELANYLNGRMVREAKAGNKDAILEHALTALHMGDFRPKMDGVKVPTGTGNVNRGLEFARTTNAALKNMFFGIADVGAIMGNAVPAIMNQGPMVGLAVLNRMFKLVDLEDALKNREFSGLAMDQSQDVMSEDVGTLIGWAGRGLGDRKGGATLRAIDKPFTKWNDVLSKAQFDLLMNKGLRQPAYEGNLVLLKLLGRDVNDPNLQRAAARMANAATSTAPLARGNTRRAAEGATLSSARYLRAQGDLLLAATKLINPKASLDERIIAASAIASVIAVSAAANELAGNRLDLNPFKGVNVNPLKGDIDLAGAEFNPDFGKITLPDGTVVPFFRQKELAQTLLKTVAELDDLVKKDPTGIRDTWSRFIIGRTGPLGSTALKGLAKTGYDPVENTYNFPWEGEGFGSGMSPTQYALQMLPVPVGITGLINNDGTPLSKGLNFIGGGTYPQGDYTAALKKYGVDSMEEFEALDPDTYMTRKEKLYQENPELRAKFADTAVAKIEESKKFNSEDFMAGNRKIAQWRTYKDELAANKEGAYGAYGELGLEEKERPEKDGAAQWAWDYNQTFAQAKTDHSNEFSETNRDVLGRLQAEFWAAHPDPKVRKEILDYQILKAPTEADKLFARDMARLNGINPDTGEALTYPNGKPMPNFFTMDKYIWKEVPNDEAEEFRVGFDSWKNRQKGKVLELSVDKQIELYIETSKDVQTRANGKQWTPAAIKDVQNYGDKSKIRPLYTSYEEEMLPELLWFKPKQEWATIKAAHDDRERKD